MKTVADRAVAFYKKLDFTLPLPKGVAVMNPFKNKKSWNYIEAFLRKFYSDGNKRTLILGINPGRFSAGATGINFTDPVALADFCGIPNDFPRVRERSSEFIYAFIEQFGGPKKFYDAFFLSAVCPLGFTKDGINYNYYDSPDLLSLTEPFILETLQQQLSFGVDRKSVIILGTGKNQKFFAALNAKYGFFETIYTLEHPRYILQYKRKNLDEYIQKYIATCNTVLQNKK